MHRVVGDVVVVVCRGNRRGMGGEGACRACAAVGDVLPGFALAGAGFGGFWRGRGRGCGS